MITPLLWLSLVAATPSVAAATPFDASFTGATLRFDYFHSGTAGEEHVSFDQVRLEGEWPGSRTQLLDTTNFGKYLFEVVDMATNRTLYSRGFSSLYGEWEITGEALGGAWRTFQESQRFPEPRRRVQLVLKKRRPDGSFGEFFTTVVDPAHRSVNRSPIAPDGQVWTVFENGPAATKVDLLFISDGYTAAEQAKFRADAERLAGNLFSFEPFARHRGDFNVRALAVPSVDSGITNPRSGVWHNTALGLTYNAFDSDRYVLTFENKRLREIAAQAPYDALILVANNRKYGGGGIFNLWLTAAADSGQSPYLIVHEFGHSFADLADEYYTSQVAYDVSSRPGTEPWEANVTALLDPAQLKWKDLVAADTPLPTPWNQEEYDKASLAYQERREAMRAAGASEEAMEALFDEIKATTQPMLEAGPYYGQVGAFEGASYQAKGLYRPSADCIMFSRNPDYFCPVCSRALEQVIALYTQ